MYLLILFLIPEPSAPLNLQSNGVSTFNSIPLQWSPPDMPNGVILDYEV